MPLMVETEIPQTLVLVNPVPPHVPPPPTDHMPPHESPRQNGPMPLIQWEDETQSFKPCPGALHFLRAIECRIVVVAICGAARTGKSFLLNRILQIANDARASAHGGVCNVQSHAIRDAPLALGDSTFSSPSSIPIPVPSSSNSRSALGPVAGFKVSSSIEPCTRGLWLCASPTSYTAPDGSQWRLMLVDTEGVDALDSDENQMARVLALALLLSSVVLLNQRGPVTSSSLTRLHLATEIARIVQEARYRASLHALGSGQGRASDANRSEQDVGSSVSVRGEGSVNIASPDAESPRTATYVSGMPDEARTPVIFGSQGTGTEGQAAGAPQSKGSRHFQLTHALGTEEASGEVERAQAPGQTLRHSIECPQSLELATVREGVEKDSLGFTTGVSEEAQAPQGGPETSFPALFWVLRDFGLSLGQGQTPATYLDGTLLKAPECVGSAIQEAFPERACFALPRPAQDEEVVQDLERVPFWELAGGFQTGVGRLVGRVMEAAEAVGTGERATSGASLADSVQFLVQALNGAVLPEVRSSTSALEHRVYREALESSMALYADLTSDSGTHFTRDSSTDDRSVLRAKHEAGALQALALFQRRVKGVGQGASAFKKNLEDLMREQFEMRDFKFQEKESLAEAQRIREEQEVASTEGSWSQPFLENLVPTAAAPAVAAATAVAAAAWALFSCSSHTKAGMQQSSSHPGGDQHVRRAPWAKSASHRLPALPKTLSDLPL